MSLLHGSLLVCEWSIVPSPWYLSFEHLGSLLSFLTPFHSVSWSHWAIGFNWMSWLILPSLFFSAMRVPSSSPSFSRTGPSLFLNSLMAFCLQFGSSLIGYPHRWPIGLSLVLLQLLPSHLGPLLHLVVLRATPLPWPRLVLDCPPFICLHPVWVS